MHDIPFTGQSVVGCDASPQNSHLTSGPPNRRILSSRPPLSPSRRVPLYSASYVIKKLEGARLFLA